MKSAAVEGYFASTNRSDFPQILRLLCFTHAIYCG
jgi:hypothetical protein